MLDIQDFFLFLSGRRLRDVGAGVLRGAPLPIERFAFRHCQLDSFLPHASGSSFFIGFPVPPFLSPEPWIIFEIFFLERQKVTHPPLLRWCF